jgi:hypothetical protein
MKLSVLTGCGCALLFGLVVAVGEDLSIGQVMTPAQLQATGVTTLTPAQRAALDRWLNDYTLRVLQVATAQGPITGGAPGAAYAGIGSGHWVKKASNGGRLVELEDGSLWEINAIDRTHTVLWLPVSNITVITAKAAIGDYNYTLINKDNGEAALAKFLGR